MSTLVELIPYTGNGSSQSVATSFLPRVMIIKQRAAINSVIKTDTMTGNDTAFFGGATGNFTGGVTSVPTGNSFALGADSKVNANAAVYDALVLGGTTSELGTGTYTGDNGADQSKAAGLTPVLVFVKGNTTSAGLFRTTSHPADTCSRLSGATILTTGIRNFSGTNFTVSSSANATAVVYHWFAVPADASLLVFAYAGNATNPRNITGASFTPDFALIKAADANQGGMRTVDSANTYQIMNFSTLANAIDALISGGVTVNSTFNASAVDHYGWAMVEHLADATGQPTQLRHSQIPFARPAFPRGMRG